MCSNKCWQALVGLAVRHCMNVTALQGWRICTFVLQLQRSVSQPSFPSQTWWWDHDAHRGRLRGEVTGFGSFFRLSLLFYLYFLSKVVLHSNPNERWDYEIWRSKTCEKMVPCGSCGVISGLLGSVCGYCLRWVALVADDLRSYRLDLPSNNHNQI